MPHVLDQMAGSSGYFRPKTATEFFALQLARKLNDTANLQRYLALVERHSESLLLQAFRKAVNGQGRRQGLAERFQAEVKRLKQKEEKYGFGTGSH